MAARKPLALALLALALLLPLIAPAHAVGFANLPATTEFLFSPGKTVEVPLYVVRGSAIDVTVSAPSPDPEDAAATQRAQSILSYVSLDDPAPKGGERELTLRIAFPQQMEPGTYLIDVWATDRPPQQEATIMAVASVKMRLTVRVLSPDPLLEVTGISVPASAQGLAANATLTVASRSAQDVPDAVAAVNVYSNGTLVASGTTRHAMVLSGETVALTAALPTEGLAGGDYDVNATVSYGGRQASSAQETLRIGTLHVDVPDYTRTLLFNATNRFSFTIANRWNRDLHGAYATLRLAGAEKTTATHDIPAFGTTGYEVYFDRESSLVPGHAPVNITISYSDYDPASGEYVAKRESIVVDTEIAAPAAQERPAIATSTLVLSATLALLVLLLVAALVLLSRSHAHGEGPAAQPPSPIPPAGAAQATQPLAEEKPRGP